MTDLSENLIPGNRVVGCLCSHAVQIVCPGVIRAYEADLSGRSALFPRETAHDSGTAVCADVGKRVDFIFSAPAHHCDRAQLDAENASNLSEMPLAITLRERLRVCLRVNCEEVTLLGYLVDPPDDSPAGAEHALLLLEPILRRVAGGFKRRGLQQRPPGRGVDR